MLIIFKWSAKFPKNTPFKSRLHPIVGGFCRVLRQKVYGRNCEAGKPITELPVQCPGSPDSVPGAEGRRCIRLSPIPILHPVSPQSWSAYKLPVTPQCHPAPVTRAVWHQQSASKTNHITCRSNEREVCRPDTGCEEINGEGNEG